MSTKRVSEESEGTESSRAISRRRLLGAAAVAAAGTGGLLASVAPARAQGVGFGAVPVGSVRTREITTENPVGRPIEVTDLTITGSDAEAFTVVEGDAPFTLGAAGSHTTRIRFAPTSPGEKSARVRVDTATRSSLKAGRLTGTGVERGATGASATDDTPPESDESSVTASSDDSSAESASTDRSSSTPTDTSSSGTSPTSQGTTDGSVSGDTGTDAVAGSETGTGTAPSDPTDGGALLTEVLDVNDDGKVNLRDFLAIVRRFGLASN